MKLTKLVLLGIAGVSLVLLPRRSSKPAKKPTALQEGQSPTYSDTSDNSINEKNKSATK